ncbi:hypothetical protein [Peribacillus asahii]|uniref:hypothetical protein n=1 Tax=Peribacillus asahii TaxID=228899 RepID=UPI00207AE9BC|nr:hypothetical protein [Peribacillus asahii]USK72643.1 hypothetical protein LIS76_23240 [Peribacillus asahii]USK72760.1 hypothetical protein LIS76_23835 [Peribacillus asahii]
MMNVCSLNYKTQDASLRNQTVELLKQLEEELGIEDLSQMREPVHILDRIHKHMKNPSKKVMVL